MLVWYVWNTVHILVILVIFAQFVHKFCYILLNLQGSIIIVGVRPQVVGVVDLKSLAHHRCGFNSCPGLWNLFMWGSYPASSWNIGDSTWVSSHAWNNTHSRAFPPLVKLESRYITFTMLVRHKSQQKNFCVYIISSIGSGSTFYILHSCY